MKYENRISTNRRLLAAEIFSEKSAGRLYHEVVQPFILRLGKCLFKSGCKDPSHR